MLERTTNVHASSQKEALSRRLCVLLSCVAFANLPFMQEYISDSGAYGMLHCLSSLYSNKEREREREG